MSKIITDDIRNRFKALQADGDLGGIIEYLSSLLTNGDVDNMLAGFCYWNISDSYAMQRKPNELYNNHEALNVGLNTNAYIDRRLNQ